jgi:nicotinate-nucleotide adenylyltransferase
MRPEIIALYGGAFDPPTKGHKAIVTRIIEDGLADRVWVVPCKDHRFKKVTTSIDDRINMLRFAFDADYEHWLKVSISNYEDENDTKGRTWDLAEGVRRWYNIDRKYLKIVIGQDNADNITGFYRGTDLIKAYKFIVVKRNAKDWMPKKPWYLRDGHMLITTDKQEVSSTRARKKVKELMSDIEPLVAQHIFSEKLYIGG